MTHKSDIAFDDLDYQPEGLYLLESKPFSGVAVDYNASGVKVSEAHFSDGREHGVFRAWHTNGRLSMERPYTHGESHGLAYEWFGDGSLMSMTEFEFGVMMRREVRDQEGNVTEVFERSPTDVLYQNVLKRRADFEIK